jgi:hypothetical protein
MGKRQFLLADFQLPLISIVDCYGMLVTEGGANNQEKGVCVLRRHSVEMVRELSYIEKAVPAT